MAPRESPVVLILADISGYTRFMVANQLAAVHGQMIITALLEAILREVDIPLRLQGIEGDAVFVYAEHPGDDDAWQQTLTAIGRKLLRFFEVFAARTVEAMESTPCGCDACTHLEELTLKVIAHSGRAVFSTIAGTSQISGTDVILLHRLLKNSVPSSEYLLMTAAAHRDLGAAIGGSFTESQESYPELGTVQTFVRYLRDAKKRQREAFYALPPEALARRGNAYVIWAVRSQFRAIVDQIRHPTVAVSWPRRLGFILQAILTAPFMAAVMLAKIPRKLLARQAARQRAT